jgi:gluconate 2-dehydrogenase gamma chain
MSRPELSAAQRATLGAAMERILPGGDGPGATDANALGYVDWLTRQPRFAPAAHTLATGLALLDSMAAATAGAPFAACPPAGQDEVLRRVQMTPHPTVQRFFVMLVRMTLDGFLGAPAYGGNRGGSGWAYIGFDPHPYTAAGPKREAA